MDSPPKNFEDLSPGEFFDFMSAQGYATVKVEGDHWYGILRFLFTTAIIKGHTRDYATGYSDRWCYSTGVDAIVAFAAWMDNNFQGEPDGWHRNPKTGRRREKGDAAREFIAW